MTTLTVTLSTHDAGMNLTANEVGEVVSRAVEAHGGTPLATGTYRHAGRVDGILIGVVLEAR